MIKLQRLTEKPVLEPMKDNNEDSSWERGAVLNCAAIYDNGLFHGLQRPPLAPPERVRRDRESGHFPQEPQPYLERTPLGEGLLLDVRVAHAGRSKGSIQVLLCPQEKGSHAARGSWLPPEELSLPTQVRPERLQSGRRQGRAGLFFKKAPRGLYREVKRWGKWT